jgi:riboflavin biosynthesis pyrimidine reductase
MFTEGIMQKPYVIIHTHISLDGRIHVVDSPKFETTSQQYQELALKPDKQIYDFDGYLNGRVTTDDNQTHYRKPDVNDDARTVPEGDFVATADAPMYYVSIDPSGRLAWQQNYVDYGGVDSHVIEVITERVSNAYKDFLRRMNISYVIAGKERIDNALALHKLAEVFGMKRVMIGGGGVLNWSFLNDDLVDEVSIVNGPFADGSSESPGLFTAAEPLSQEEARSFTLIEAKPLNDSAVLLRYSVDKR